jgi:hypothetical protein
VQQPLYVRDQARTGAADPKKNKKAEAFGSVVHVIFR